MPGRFPWDFDWVIFGGRGSLFPCLFPLAPNLGPKTTTTFAACCQHVDHLPHVTSVQVRLSNLYEKNKTYICLQAMSNYSASTTSPMPLTMENLLKFELDGIAREISKNKAMMLQIVEEALRLDAQNRSLANNSSVTGGDGGSWDERRCFDEGNASEVLARAYSCSCGEHTYAYTRELPTKTDTSSLTKRRRRSSSPDHA